MYMLRMPGQSHKHIKEYCCNPRQALCDQYNTWLFLTRREQAMASWVGRGFQLFGALASRDAVLVLLPSFAIDN